MDTHPARTTVDWSVVEAAQAGDPGAFDTIYRTYHHRLVGFGVSALHLQHADAEDIASEVFLRLHQKISTITDKGVDLMAWLSRVARNLSTDRLRSHACSRTVPVADVGDRPTGDDVATAVVDAVVAAQLWAYVDGLGSPRAAECVRWRIGADLSVRETAAVMGLMEGGVRIGMFRAMTKLRVMPEVAAMRRDK